jgi:hypothetical protein
MIAGLWKTGCLEHISYLRCNINIPTAHPRLQKSHCCTCQLQGHTQEGGRSSTSFQRKFARSASGRRWRRGRPRAAGVAGGAAGGAGVGRRGPTRPASGRGGRGSARGLRGQRTVRVARAAPGQQSEREARARRPNMDERIEWLVLETVCLQVTGATNQPLSGGPAGCSREQSWTRCASMYQAQLHTSMKCSCSVANESYTVL